MLQSQKENRNTDHFCLFNSFALQLFLSHFFSATFNRSFFLLQFCSLLFFPSLLLYFFAVHSFALLVLFETIINDILIASLVLQS